MATKQLAIEQATRLLSAEPITEEEIAVIKSKPTTDDLIRAVLSFLASVRGPRTSVEIQQAINQSNGREDGARRTLRLLAHRHLVEYPAGRGRPYQAEITQLGQSALGLASALTSQRVPTARDKSNQPLLKPRNNSKLDDLTRIASEVEESGYFDPSNETDARKRVTQEIVQRQGQSRFRQQLIEAYRGRCAVTGCSVLEVLEAAHVVPYRGEQTNTVANGLLLRADIHTLFDLNLLGINPDDFTVTIAECALGGTYNKLNGKKLRLPRRSGRDQFQKLLRIRWREFLESSGGEP